MLQSLFALPLGAGAEALLFLILYLITPFNGRQVAVITVVLALATLFLVSLTDWPGADVLAMYVAVLAVTGYLLGIISHAREQRRVDQQAGRRWFHWGPAIIVIFFVVLFALDGVLVVVSKQGLPGPIADRLLPKSSQQQNVRSVFPGTVANDFQKKESLYNEYLEQVKQQEQRGWQVNKGWLLAPVVGREVPFQIQVSDADGAPVDFAEVSGIFQRPSDSSMDRSFDMHEIEPGLYRRVLALPQPGQWNLILTIRRGDQVHELRASTTVAESGE